jgi:hypothetical protein
MSKPRAPEQSGYGGARQMSAVLLVYMDGVHAFIYMYLCIYLFGHRVDILDECDATHCTVSIYNIYAIKVAQFHCVRVAI